MIFQRSLADGGGEVAVNVSIVPRFSEEGYVVGTCMVEDADSQAEPPLSMKEIEV